MKPLVQIRNRYLLLIDLILIVTGVLASFALRLDLGPAFSYYMPSALKMIAVAVVIKPLVYFLFGLYRRYWVYASIRELRLILFATVAASVWVSVVVLFIRSLGGFIEGFPRSVLGIDWLLSLFSVGGLRVIIRVLAETGQISQKSHSARSSRRLIIAGAGAAGVLVVRELQRNPQMDVRPVGFVDDDPEKMGKEIHGINVLGRLDQVGEVVEKEQADEVIIAIPTAPGQVIRLVTDQCRQKRIPFRTMPGMYELIGGKVSVNRLRNVAIDDLLRREPAVIDDEAVGRTLSSKRILVTGAGGSIGTELCRQIARWMPSQLILLGHGENSIFEALIELTDMHPNVPIVPVIADIRDYSRIVEVFETFKPEVVFHTAAHKHVHLMEANVEEAVTNNVFGTMSVVDAALDAGTERLVLISTDKAVQPRSVMGATKRMAEMVVHDAAARSGRPFCAVRFGNVLGSRGSIVPIFKRQIARGGPVTVTHPEMKRYFMTIPEAVHLVLQAASMGTGGELYVLRMGEQVHILDLAEDLIRLSGLEPGRDIEITFTGIRPGEKLSESLLDDDLEYQETSHPDIVVVEDNHYATGVRLRNAVEELVRLADEGDVEAILGLLRERIPGSRVGSEPPPDYSRYV
jgi:FlaA1/EpsC-like NDP-sugar epimerase